MPGTVLKAAKHLLLGAVLALAALYVAGSYYAPSEADRLLEERADEPGPQPLRTHPFPRLDRNADGGISLRESRQNPELENRFRDFDRNGDGRIDTAEFRAFVENRPARFNRGPGLKRDSGSR